MFFEFITLPVDWQTTVLGHAGNFFTDVWPIIALVVGLGVVAFAIRFIVGIFR